MTNSGAALFRKDSLTALRFKKSVDPQVAASTSELANALVVRESSSGKKGTRKEQGRRKPTETPKEPSETFPEDLVTTLATLQLDAETSRDAFSIVQNGNISLEVPADDTASTTASETETPGLVQSPQKRKTKRKSSKPSSSSNLTQESSTFRLSQSLLPNNTAPMRPTSLLIASLGNPPPYHSTRHSAAHIILKHLQTSLNLPAFTLKSRPYGGGHVSVGADIGRPDITLWQSPSLMNASGPPLLKAWKHFLNVQSISTSDPITGLIVLHDEMETESGRVKAKRGNTSPRGHNGIKSVQSTFGSAGLMTELGDRYVKVGIGIGRPTTGSRDSRDVSAYVLGQLTQREKDGLENATGDLINMIYQEMARIGGSA